MSSIQSIRTTFATETGCVSSSSAAGPGVAAYVGIIFGVDLSVLRTGDILATWLLDCHLDVAGVSAQDSLPLIDGTLQVGHASFPHSDGATCVDRDKTLVAALGHFYGHLESIQQPRCVRRYCARPIKIRIVTWQIIISSNLLTLG